MISLYDYDLWLEVVRAGVSNLTDPRTPDDETPIFPSGVEIGKPNKVDFWNNPGATLIFANVIKTEDVGIISKQKTIQTVQGAVITFVPGNDGPAISKTLHLTDIVGDLFDKTTAFGPGVETRLLPSISQGWRAVDISKVIPLNANQLKMTSTGTTVFQIDIPKKPELAENGKIKKRF